MKILKKEVETVYTIRFTNKDFTDAFYGWLEHPLKDCSYAGAFNNYTLKTTVTDTYNLFKSFNLDAITLQYIAKEHFGFYGVKHYGMYDKKTDTRLLTVYNMGDCLNV